MNLFKKRDAEDPQQAARLQAIRELRETIRRILTCTEDDTVIVQELACMEPGCPPIETVIGIQRQDGSQTTIKIHLPVTEVSEWTLIAHLASAPCPCPEDRVS